MIDWLAPSPLDRAVELRADDDWVRATWADQRSRLLFVGEAGVSATVDGLLDARPTAGDFDPERHYLLGVIDGVPWFATAGSDGVPLVPLRAVMDGLPAADLQAAFTASGLVVWHLNSAFCSRCGSSTGVVAAGMARRCSNCAREDYPRTDPAVIVAILDDDDRLLLGRQPSWAPGRHSVFAGFAEMGESLEQAVHREMAEEVALELRAVTYLGSQPWPFPRSLMVGFTARATSTDVTTADGEIETARWFTRDRLRQAVSTREVGLPPQTSIARRMIEAWLAGELTPPGRAKRSRDPRS